MLQNYETDVAIGKPKHCESVKSPIGNTQLLYFYSKHHPMPLPDIYQKQVCGGML